MLSKSLDIFVLTNTGIPRLKKGGVNNFPRFFIQQETLFLKMDRKHAREYEDDDEADEELMPSAFAVEGEMSPEEGPPTSGMDYLKRVRYFTQIPRLN